MGIGERRSGIVVLGENGNGNKVLSWEWKGMGTVKVIPAHL